MNDVLVICDVGPTREFTGGLVLHNISRALSGDFKVDWLILHDKNIGHYKLDSFNPKTVFYSINKPSENWSDKKYLLGFNIVAEKLAEFDFRNVWLEIDQIVSTGEYSKIVVVLQGQTSFRIAAKLQENGITFSTLNWDPWVWWARHKNVPLSFNSIVERVYKNLFSGRHMVPTMEFAKRYNIPIENVVILYPHIEQNSSAVLHGALNSNESEPKSFIELGFAGQIYAKKEFDELLRELDKLGWKIANLPVRLHYFGGSRDISNPNVINHGWVDPSLLIHELSKLDIGILTYPAFESIPEVSNLSFPSKFATYCAAGIPTVYIGPANTPVSKMITEDTEIEFSGDQQNISFMIEYCFNNRTKIAQRVQHRHKMFFSRQAFCKSMSEAFSISELLPTSYLGLENLQTNKLLQIRRKNYSNALETLTDWRSFLRVIRSILGKFIRVIRSILGKFIRIFLRFFDQIKRILKLILVKALALIIFVGILLKSFVKKS